MKLSDITSALGITEYPKVLDHVYTSAKSRNISVCDYALLAELEAEYGIFGKFYEAVKAGMEALEQDLIRLPWANTLAAYFLDAPFEECVKVPVVPTDGTPAGDMLYMLAMLPLIPASIEAYRQKGFSEDMLRQMIGTCYQGGIQIVQERTGRPGMDKLYFGWLMTYAKARIFNHAGFMFEIKRFPEHAVLLRHNDNGKIAILLRGTYHKSGRVLGSLGCQDETESRRAAYDETENGWHGLYAENGLASQNSAKFPKSEWTCILQPGDSVLSLHIPRNADLSDEALNRALDEGLSLAKLRYPECTPKCIYCASWLLDPALKEMLGAESKISKFGARFLRYPVLSSGREVFTFVFRTSNYDPTSLPENTRLERGLKKRYLEGSAIHSFQGVIF